MVALILSILSLSLIHIAKSDFEMTPEMLRDQATINLTLSGDAHYGFYFTDIREACDWSGNIDFDDLSLSYNVTQTFLDPDTSKVYKFIPNPSYDIMSSKLDSSLEYSTQLVTDDSFFKDGEHYATQKIVKSEEPKTCLHALRLTNAAMNSYGYATITEKQCILYGFDTTFTVNLFGSHLQ